ncbi:Nickel and cobalt resistance protein CnrA [bacterium HR10]|nr:Nickel and cobalt resistance protein CnrA [bacterium HR10]
MLRVSQLRLSLILLLAAGLACRWIYPHATAVHALTIPQPGTLALVSPSVLANFNGDNRLDLATSSRHAGHGYKVTIRLSARQRVTSLALSSGAPVIGLLALDVDRDNDLDLILAGAIPPRPLAAVKEKVKELNRGRDMGRVVQEMQERVRATVSFPPGYFVTRSGEFENQQRAMARLLIIVPVSLFLIFSFSSAPSDRSGARSSFCSMSPSP